MASLCIPVEYKSYTIPDTHLTVPLLFVLEREWKQESMYVDQGHNMVYVGTFRGKKLEITPACTRTRRAFRNGGQKGKTICTITLYRYCGSGSIWFRFC